MINANYAPRPLSVSREYPGYQFYAILHLEGHDAEDCFRYTALTIQNWLCERIKKANGTVPDEIVCPPPDNYMNTSGTDLRSCKLPFAEIISIRDHGIWALMVREPDLKIAARSFVTHAAVRVKDDKEIEFGTYIDVVDRDPALSEIDKAYRPQFIRLLFKTEGMTLRQAAPLEYKKYIDIRDRRGVGRLKELADDRANQLPLIVFTHTKREETPPADIERMIADIMKTPPIPAFALPALRPGPPDEAVTPVCEIPYDVREFADHIYGFAQAYAVAPEAFGELRSKFGRVKLNEGDILVIEPKAFGGSVHVMACQNIQASDKNKSTTDELMASLLCYSKRKPYTFGGVLFIEDAKQLMRTLELAAIRASIHLENGGESQQVLDQLEQERELSAQQAKQIADLRTQMLGEYQRGVESAQLHIEKLDEQLNEAKAENAQLRSRIDGMQQAFSEFGAMKEAIGRVQSIKKCPNPTMMLLHIFA